MFLNIVSVIKDACKGPLELGKQQRKSMSLWFYIPDFGLIQLPTDNFKIKKKNKGFGNQCKWTLSFLFNVKEK